AANHGGSHEFETFLKEHPIRPGRGTIVGRTALESRVIHFPDILADADFIWHESQQLGGFRTALGVPLLREGSAVGVMALARTKVQPFSTKQIELVTTFADQAVIAPVCKPVAGVELGLVTDKFWAVLVERHRLALEIGYDQQVRQIFRAALR